MFIRVTALAYREEKDEEHDESYNKVLQELNIEGSEVKREEFYKEIIMNTDDFMMIHSTEEGSIIDTYPMQMSKENGEVGIYSKSIRVKETLDELETKIND